MDFGVIEWRARILNVNAKARNGARATEGHVVMGCLRGGAVKKQRYGVV